MNSKGSLGSIVASVIAVFLVIICSFYLSFTFKSNQLEKDAVAYAHAVAGDDETTDAYIQSYKTYLDSIGKESVFLGYTGADVRRWSVNLGLDLKGGMNVTLQVNMGDMLRSMSNNPRNTTLNRAIAATDSIALTNSGLNYINEFINQYRIAAGNPNTDFSVTFSDVILKNGNDAGEVEKALVAEVHSRVETSSANVLRNRIDAFGVVSPNIQVIEGKQGQVLLELPGVKDHDRMLSLLKKSANLEFYEMYFTGDEYILPSLEKSLEKAMPELGDKLQVMQPGAHPVLGYVNGYNANEVLAILNKYPIRNDLKLALSNKPVNGTDNIYEIVMLKTTVDNETGQKLPAMSGEYVVEARAELDQMSRNVVSMRMNSEGARLWGNITTRNVGKPVAVVLDDQVYSYPNINEPIKGGSSQISGSFTLQEAQDLANVLKSGRMPARISVIDSMVIGPSLGQQAIQDGMMSFAVALVLLMIFMMAMYGVIPGLVANLGLILNIFFIFGILASFQAVLTLSGIAGIVLSLGMAVDANVLIFERTKEELRAGKNARTAIFDGYSNAFSAIFDGNLTSIITGIILLLFGTGPIKGFATTLIIGLCCSFFTAVYLTRIVFVIGTKKKAFQNLTFTTKLSKNIFANAKYNFLGARKVSFAIVGIIIAAFVASLFTLKLKPGIDFSGGRNYTVKFAKNVDPQDVREVLAPVFGDASLSVINIENRDQIRVSTNYRINETDSDIEADIEAKMFKAFSDANLIENMTPEQFSTTDSDHGIVASQKVGPTVANDMRQAAYIAVSLALVAMFLYILLRFNNMAFSLGALAAVSFTAFFIIGLYSVCHSFVPFSMEIDQTFIAAILTIIGYQINDTVVVFDRVRENITLFPKQNFFDLVNKSINSTLGRTVMTSLSTLIVLICIFLLGGEAIRAFSFAMSVGVIVGTLATIFVAAPVAYLTYRKKA